MRHAFIFGAFALLLGLSGCKKDAPRPFSTDLVGEWQWESSVGGFTGKSVHTPSTTGREQTYRFERDSTFVECVNNRCSVPVKFTFRTLSSIFDGKPHRLLVIPRRVYLAAPDTGYHIVTFRYTVQEVSNKLRLAQEMPDGYVESYTRK